MAASPTVMVRILGDASNLAKSFGAVGDKASGVAKQAHAAFSNMLGMLNQTGVLGPFGEALNTVDQALAHIEEHGKKVSDVLLAAGGATAGVGVGLTLLGSKEKAAHQQLDQAITNTGYSYGEYGKQIEEAIKHGERFGQTSAETQNALQTLTQATGNPTKALQLYGVTLDLAAAKHEDLNSAATAVGKTYNGNTRLLKQFGINLTATTTLVKQAATAQTQVGSADQRYATAKQKLMDLETIDHAKKHLTIADHIALRNAEQNVVLAAQKDHEAHLKLIQSNQAVTKATAGNGEALTLLSAKLKGQAAAAADTFSGRMKAISVTVEDQVAKFGQKYGPALQGAGAAMAGLGSAMKIGQAAMAAFSTGTEAAAAADDVLAASETAADVSGAPIIVTVGAIVLAIAALGVAAYVIYRNWKTIWAGMKDAIEVVWKWIKSNWYLLLGIITGPIGLAAALIYKYRDDIWNAFKDVYNWLRDKWDDIYAWLKKPFTDAVTAITTAWNAVVSFFTGLPGKVGSWFSSLATTLSGPFTGAVTAVTSAWGSVVTFFTNLPTDIASWFGGLASTISSPFKDAFNGIANIWNNTVGSLSFKVPSWIPGLGGKGFSMPQIPTFETGGIMPYTGLALVHAGETIVPARTPVRSGPAVVIQDAHFSSEVDIDLFTRRLGWHLQTQGV